MIGKGKVGLQVRTTKSNGWTKARRKIFLEALATTCNVEHAARAAGMAASGAYRLRHRDGEFAGAWAAAIMSGRERLKERLLAHLLGQLPGDDHPGDLDPVPAPAPFDPDRAMAALKTLAVVDGTRGMGAGARPDYATDAEVTVLLMERLNDLAATLARGGPEAA